MIDISHAQAQRIIRGALDRPATEQQWRALQAHLENCPACRDYRAQRLRLEKTLRRGMHARWLVTTEMLENLCPVLVQRRRQRAARDLLLLRAAQALVVLGAVLGIILYRRANPPRPLAAVDLAPAAPTPTSPPAFSWEQAFQGVVAFDAPVRGAGDILLLSPGPRGPEITNLTRSPAQDSSPAWSPDGQWIAFLSRPEGDHPTNDIYVISVAGTRLTRLTADPGITWQAPLAWSPDGQWLAAAGSPVVAGQPAAAGSPAEAGKSDAAGKGDEHTSLLYRINLSGGAPQPLPNTRGASLPRFAPRMPLLAFIVEDRQLSFLRVYDALHRTTHDLTRHEALRGSRAGEGSIAVSAFDWSPDGQSLLYLSLKSEPFRDPAETQIRVIETRGLAAGNSGAALVKSSYSRLMASFPFNLPAISAGISPEGELLYTRTFRRSGRWVTCHPLATLDQGPAVPPDSRALDTLGFCIDGPIERASWTADGRWMVLAARASEADAPGIYAFSIPDRAEGVRALQSTRLADLPEGAGPLRVRPGGQVSFVPVTGRLDAALSLPINPQPVTPLPAGAVASSLPPEALLERAVLTRQDAQGWNIMRLAAGGSRLSALEAGHHGFCARSSPDGVQVAYVATDPWMDMEGSVLYLMDREGSATRRATRMEYFADPVNPLANRAAPGMFGCPSWSPDGKTLAAWVEAANQSYLALIPVGGTPNPAGGLMPTRPARYIPLDPAGIRTTPVWTRDSREVILFLQPRDGREAVVAAVNEQNGELRLLASRDGWEAASDARLSPDGRLVAFAALHFTGGYEVQTAIRILRTTGWQPQDQFSLPAYSALTSASGYNHLAWISGAAGKQGEPRLGLAFHGSADGRAKSALLLYEPASRRLLTLASLEEEILSAAWSADGQWVLYSTPGGLWSLSIPGALAGVTAPVWLNDTTAYEIDWK